MSKRGDGAGTVYDSPVGSGRWWAQLPIGPDGKRPRKYAGDGATKADAEKLLRQMHAEREAGRDLSRKVETVTELMDSYVKSLGGQQAASTRKNTTNRAKHITAHIGALRIDAVTFETAQGLANRLVKTISPQVSRAILQLLHGAYESVIPERVSRNPVDWRRLLIRKSRPAKRHPLEVEQVRNLLAAADNQAALGANYRYAIFVWLAALTGMRRAEIAGVTWRDVEWEKSELRVRTQIALTDEGTYEPGQTLKTGDSERIIPLGPRLLARLRQQWNAHQAERKLYGTDWKEYGLIVCLPNGEPIRQLPKLNVFVRHLGEAAHIERLFPHLLRHTLATAISDAGFSETIIAGILGHKNGTSITARYTHATKGTMRKAMLAVEDRIFGTADAAREAL